MSGGRTVKVTTLQVECPQEPIDPLREGRVLSSPQTLTCDDTSIHLVLEWGQHPLEGSNRPGNVIVGKDNDLGGDFRNGSCHLASLVCVLDRHASDSLATRCWHLVHSPLRLVH